jgi:hypothetical protein
MFKNKYFRDFLHILAGLIFGYLLSLTFEGVIFVMQLFFTAFSTAIIATFYEVGMHLYNKDNKVNKFDITITTIAALISVIYFYIW